MFARAARSRPRHRRGRPRGPGGCVPAGRGNRHDAVRRLRCQPRLGDGRGRRGARCRLGHRLDRRPRRRQLARLRQGHQLRSHQRRHDARLPRVRQSGEAAAADDRHSDDRWYRQRCSVLRADLRHDDAREDGLRRHEGRVSRGHPRSGAHGVTASRRYSHRRVRRPVARRRVLRHDQTY